MAEEELLFDGNSSGVVSAASSVEMDRLYICAANHTTGNGSSSLPCVSTPYSPLTKSTLTVHIQGFVNPVLILFTIVTNFLVCLVLGRKNMQSPTNMILIGMAVSDTLTGVCPLPCFLYFYTAGRYDRSVPYEWCFAYLCLTDFLPTIFHTASVWLTVALAVQRYLRICHGHSSSAAAAAAGAPGSGWCGNCRDTVKVIAVIYVAAVLPQLSRFFESNFVPVYDGGDASSGHRQSAPPQVIGCHFTYKPFIRRHINVYFNVYFWFRVVCIHVIPCVALVLLNAVLVQTMRSAQRRRKQLLALSRKTEWRRLAESNHTTKMLVIVVCVFLLVEVPLAVHLVLYIAENTFSFKLLSREAQTTASLFINLFIILSYPINFFIYCGMSDKFRSTFRLIVRCRRKPEVNSTEMKTVTAYA